MWAKALSCAQKAAATDANLQGGGGSRACYDGAVRRGGGSAAHPVSFEVEPAYTGRPRLSGALRPLLALPHLLFTGGPSLLGVVLAPLLIAAGLAPLTLPLAIGAFGVLAAVATVASWLAIVARGRQPRDLREFAIFFLRWRMKAVTYAALLRDEFPPFGYGDYPARLALAAPPPQRARLAVALRLPLLLPHAVALAALNAVLAPVGVAGWLAVVLFGRYPRPLYGFSAGVVRWSLRVEAYLLLLHDCYPPFRLD